MTTTYVAYDKRHGQILSVHHGAADADDARTSAHDHPEFSDENVGVIEVAPGSIEPQKLYKVDAGGTALVEVTDEEGGVGFSVGVTGETY